MGRGLTMNDVKRQIEEVLQTEPRDDLVHRLRSEANLCSPSPLTLLIDDAADRIEELEDALADIKKTAESNLDANTGGK